MLMHDVSRQRSTRPLCTISSGLFGKRAVICSHICVSPVLSSCCLDCCWFEECSMYRRLGCTKVLFEFGEHTSQIHNFDHVAESYD